MQEPPRPLPVRILHLEDSEIDHQLAARALRQAGLQFHLKRVETLAVFQAEIEQAQFDIILADYRLAGFTALDAWAVLAKSSFQPPFVILSGAIGEQAAVDAIKLGMSDYLAKDEVNKLAHVIGRALTLHDARVAKEKADAELAASEQRMAHFAEHLQTTIEQERAAIAREIHDDIGGSLAAIKFDLAWIGRHGSDAATQAHVQAATDMLHHALGASQRIMMSLRPAILDQGLVAALDWLASGFERRTGIKSVLRTRLDKTNLDKAIELTAYRCAQEALTNVSKHAHCSQVQLDLSDAGQVLTLEITDNGQGMEQADRAKITSFGLKGLRERAKTVGGWLDVSSRPGAGTSVILSIPLAPALVAGSHGHQPPQEAFE
jgi:signal transduction histidine kinase